MADIRFTAFVQGVNQQTGTGRNPALSFTKSGTPVLGFNTAEPHSVKDDTQQNGYRKTGTTYRQVTIWGEDAERWQNVAPGTRVEIIGREETREFEKQDGSRGYSLEVRADFMRVAPSRNGSQQGGYQNSAGQTPAQMQQNAQNQNRAPQGNDPWAAQSGGNYDWGSGAENEPPF